MKGCAWTQKTEPSLNFYVYAQTLMQSLYFIYVRKINARTHVKGAWTDEGDLINREYINSESNNLCCPKHLPCCVGK